LKTDSFPGGVHTGGKFEVEAWSLDNSCPFILVTLGFLGLANGLAEAGSSSKGMGNDLDGRGGGLLVR
jgi:hypothetical protein